MKKTIYVIIASLVIILGGGFLLARAADASEPGDTLYSIDLLAESVKRLVTLDPVAKAELEEAILDERASELTALLDASADEGLVEESVTNIDQQRTRLQDQIQLLSDNSGEKEELQNRYQEQVQEQIQNMEKVQTKYQNVGEDSMLKLQEEAKTMEGNTNGNTEQNSGDTTQNSEQNNSDTSGNSSTSGSSKKGN